MDRKPIDRWAWGLIYAGLLALALGWFYENFQPATGWAVMAAGAAAFAVGAVLIFVRSRMGP